MAVTVNKGYTQNILNRDDLYWPDKNEMFDMLQINVMEYVPIASAKDASGSATLQFITDIQSGDTVQTGRWQAVNSTLGSRPRNKKLAKILLPVPNDINYNDQLSWSAENIGMLGKMLPILAGAAINDPGNIGTLISKMAGAGTPEFILKAISNIPGAPPAEALTSGIGGKVLNPYVEQIFKGIAMREFSFSWKLVPRNASEQNRIHNIIKTLRYYSLPNYSGTGPVQDALNSPIQVISKLEDRWLTVPNIFDLTWKQAGTETAIQSLPKIKPCVLKNIQVNYTPDNVWATHINTAGNALSGPAPVAYEVTMSFAETEIVTADNVLQGN
jgi:hypothetical protein